MATYLQEKHDQELEYKYYNESIKLYKEVI